MFRAGIATMFGVSLVLAGLSLSFPAEGRPVRVFLHDGSFVQAQALPEVRQDRAYFRLYPSGMLSVLPVERIDFEATAQAAEPAPEEVAAEARPRPRGTVSGGSGSAPVKAAPEPEVPFLELQHPQEKALEDRYALQFTQLSERQEALEDAVRALRSDEAELDRELRRYLYQPKLAGALAGKLRDVRDQLERREAELQQVGTEIHVLLTRAAGRGVRVRRLPPYGG